MRRSRIGCALAGLAIGLIFYLAYRSDRTVSNVVVRWLSGPSLYV